MTKNTSLTRSEPEPPAKHWDDLELNEVLSYLRAFPFAQIQAALKKWRVADAYLRHADGWHPFAGEVADVPEGSDWRRVGTKLQTRSYVDGAKQEARMLAMFASTNEPVAGSKKTDLSITPVPRLRCPDCSGGLFREPICAGCADGKKGFKIRLICGECDYTGLL